MDSITTIKKQERAMITLMQTTPGYPLVDRRARELDRRIPLSASLAVGGHAPRPVSDLGLRPVSDSTLRGVGVVRPVVGCGGSLGSGHDQVNQTRINPTQAHSAEVTKAMFAGGKAATIKTIRLGRSFCSPPV